MRMVASWRGWTPDNSAKRRPNSNNNNNNTNYSITTNNWTDKHPRRTISTFPTSSPRRNCCSRWAHHTRTISVCERNIGAEYCSYFMGNRMRCRTPTTRWWWSFGSNMHYQFVGIGPFCVREHKVHTYSTMELLICIASISSCAQKMKNKPSTAIDVEKFERGRWGWWEEEFTLMHIVKVTFCQ